MENAAPALVELEGVNKHFGDLHVLRDIDLTVRKGEVLVGIGPHDYGGGKSVVLSRAQVTELRDWLTGWLDGGASLSVQELQDMTERAARATARLAALGATPEGSKGRHSGHQQCQESGAKWIQVTDDRVHELILGKGFYLCRSMRKILGSGTPPKFVEITSGHAQRTIRFHRVNHAVTRADVDGADGTNHRR